MKKFLVLFFALLLASLLFARGPTKDFPYEYYTRSEASYYSSSSRNLKQLDKDSEWTVFLYDEGKTYYIVHQYEQGKEPSIEELMRILKRSQICI